MPGVWPVQECKHEGRLLVITTGAAAWDPMNGRGNTDLKQALSHVNEMRYESSLYIKISSNNP